MKNTKLNSFEDEVEMQQGKYLEFYTEQISSLSMTVPIDERILEPSYYRQVVQGINNLSEGDRLTFNIASDGGRLDGLEVVLSAIDSTDAVTIANIMGSCHSAASILALKCNVIYVSPYASMLVHFVSFGASGASNHVLKHAEHTKKVSEKLFRETYEYFLTEEEIEKCIEDDFQLYLDAEQILERLTIRQEKYQELAEQEESEDEEILDITTVSDPEPRKIVVNNKDILPLERDLDVNSKYNYFVGREIYEKDGEIAGEIFYGNLSDAKKGLVWMQETYTEEDGWKIYKIVEVPVESVVRQNQTNLDNT